MVKKFLIKRIFSFDTNIFLSVLFLLCSSFIGYSQSFIIGSVQDQSLQPIPDASVKIDGLISKGVATDFEGNFSIQIPSGKYTLTISYIGFDSFIKTLVLDDQSTLEIKAILKENISTLDDVHLNVKTEAKKIREQAFEVEVVETKGLKNTSTDINAVLKTIPGINLRQNGGLGSAFDFSLNGLTGKQVKFFLDGIPLENFGSSMTFDNFPATLIDRVEVFKGVVPIYLGADALGGAVNLVTNQRTNNFIDASYDFGSFNTHRATLNAQYHTDSGFVIKAFSYYNHSDNDYTIDGIEIRDDLGNDTGITKDNVRRFHDAYNSQMITVQSGVVHKSFADRFLLGITSSANKNEIQHPIDPQNPFGEVFTQNETFNVSLIYQKANLLKEKLHIKAYASIGQNFDKVVDTSSRKYDWFGGYIEREDKDLGEFEFSKTLFQFKDRVHLLNTFASYNLSKTSVLSFNYTKNYVKRTGKDPAKRTRIPFNDPHILDKNIMGISYDFDLITSNWKNVLFLKQYFLKSEGVIEDVYSNDDQNRFSHFDNAFVKTGYGVASTYKFSPAMQFKTSFERTFRIPEGYEIFGDGLLLKANSNLQPEESYNVNLGLTGTFKCASCSIRFDTNFFMRKTENLIVLWSEGINSRYYNTADASSIGIEGEVSATYKNIFLSMNGSYQKIQDNVLDVRIPNIPYLFGNLSVGYTWKAAIVSHDNLTFSLASYYANEFPFQSYTQGSSEERIFIPNQFSHNIQLGYSFKNGMYNLSLLGQNITDEMIYDNLNIQKPGRAFYIKFRYYLSN
ncbi:TonB-dependent receptor domain-containing protein [Aquimarina sp. W85]|uniref:TonB-dependent receptor n=1 Tax=Aquimarina rhodophyticola TaxID=3342246 RepID=UPI00366A9221